MAPKPERAFAVSIPCSAVVGLIALSGRLGISLLSLTSSLLSFGTGPRSSFDKSWLEKKNFFRLLCFRIVLMLASGSGGTGGTVSAGLGMMSDVRDMERRFLDEPNLLLVPVAGSGGVSVCFDEAVGRSAEGLTASDEPADSLATVMGWAEAALGISSSGASSSSSSATRGRGIDLGERGETRAASARSSIDVSGSGNSGDVKAMGLSTIVSELGVENSCSDSSIDERGGRLK
jgi:hypothetical protein